MCCNGNSTHTSAAKAGPGASPHVTEEVVARPLPDGYWLSAFPFAASSELPDLVGYGLGFLDKPAAVKLFHNPKNTGSAGWKVTEIQRLDFPVAMTFADLTGNGCNDIIICDRYGPNMDQLWDGKTNNGGRVQWLRNPGDRKSEPFWEAKHIGNSTGMHRLQVGHFTTKDHFQVLGFPVILKSGDRESPAPIILYTPKYGADPSQGPESWTEDTIFDAEFRLIHDVKLVPGIEQGLDTILVAGREGITLLYFDEAKGWQYNVVGQGLPQEPGNPYWGSGSVDFARVGDDSVGYIATCEAFHGNTVSVYVKKNPNAPKGPEALKDSSLWTRIVLDSFGALIPEQNTGTIHHVATGNLDGGHADSFVISCMGAPITKPENQGVYLYKPVDLVNGLFKRTKPTNESAGRAAIAGFSEPGVLDIASLSYYVPDYHTGPDPPSIRINKIRQFNIQSLTTITATKLNKEVLLQVPRPKYVPEGTVPVMPVLAVAGKKLSVMVLRPGASITLTAQDGLKVIYGQVEMTDTTGKKHVRTIAPGAKKIATTYIVSPNGVITGGPDGAVFLRIEFASGQFQGPYTSMSDLGTTNIFPPTVPTDVRTLEFPFIKVQDLDWASSGLWDDFEFYNMTGFHVYFNDDAMEQIVHWQAWTLGLSETARFHNHSDRSFCEIHSCISNGGISNRQQGGMRYFPDDYTQDIDVEKELTKAYVHENSTLLECPGMTEHGPLWKIQPGSEARPVLRPNDTVDYPWHAWLASEFGDRTLPIIPPLSSSVQKFDVWLAFEFPSSAFQY